MEFFQDTNIDFMKYRKHFVLISVALLAIAEAGALNVVWPKTRAKKNGCLS